MTDDTPGAAPGGAAPGGAAPGGAATGDPAARDAATGDAVANPRSSIRTRLKGPWRVVVEEASMLPGIAPGDWLLVDPTTRRWPKPGSVVVFREPGSGSLAIKRVKARGETRVPFNGGYIVLGRDEAWLTSDATPVITAGAGYGPPIDSDRFGPVPSALLVGRAWFRYGPVRRIGRIRRVAG